MGNKWDKLWAVIHKIIAPVILEYAKENINEFWIVTVLNVQVSGDNSYADIYVSSQKNENNLPKFLSKYSSELKKIISKKINIYKSPIIRFKLSATKNTESNIYSVINQLSKQYGLR